MRFIKYLIISIALFCSCAAKEAPCYCSLLRYVDMCLPHCGILKQKGSFVYVDVDDSYIHKLIPFIQPEGFEEPPYFGDKVGAHITVIYSDEVKGLGIGKIQECGQTIYFTPRRCEIVHPLKWQEMDEVFFIVVEAPELDRIREKYGLPKREYEFHITIGVKPKVAEAA